MKMKMKIFKRLHCGQNVLKPKGKVDYVVLNRYWEGFLIYQNKEIDAILVTFKNYI